MIVELSGVEKRYGSVHALQGADLQVPTGSIAGLIGPNGAGKTTSMEIMSSLIPRDAGTVRVAGYDPQVDPVALRNVLGYMPDFFGVYEGLRVREYLEFFAAAHRVARQTRRSVVSDLLALVDLDEKADTDVNGLSRGMKQRLSLARALVHDPEVLILDEPASGLDPRARVQLRELIAELARMGKTVIISSHILSELEGLCSYMAVIDRGRVKAQGTVEEIRGALTSGMRVVATVPVAQISVTENRLRASDDVSEIVVERDQIRFVMSGGAEASAELLATLVHNDVHVSEWRVEAAGLEELFLALTEEGAS